MMKGFSNKAVMGKQRALNVSLPLHVITFVNDRYWQESDKRESITNDINSALGEIFKQTSLHYVQVSSAESLKRFSDEKPEGIALFVPMSGSVQPWMQEAANLFDAIGIFPGYDPLLMPDHVASALMNLNAAPSTLEMFAVLKNQGLNVRFVSEPAEFIALWRSAQAVFRLQKSRLLLIGDTESWVLSAERSPETIRQRVGVRVEPVALQDLFDRYDGVSDEAAASLAAEYLSTADRIVEPTEKEVLKSIRLVIAFEQLLEMHRADGAAVACFDLLSKIDTTSCMALSYLNDHPSYIGGCEGDLDSALTLTLLKALTEKPGWMGNPIIGREMALELVHCTAALSLTGQRQAFRLRNHHESGIGVSPEVLLPKDEIMTLSRISIKEGKLSAYSGITRPMPPKPTCRTQIKIELQDMTRFMDDLLGLHQSLVFGDYSRELAICADLLGLEFCG